MELVYGKHVEQYKYIYDYADALLRWNPGSNVKIARYKVFFLKDVCASGRMQERVP